jgi:phosphopantothenoylcysteine decarboxylase/phosphopantothenate--cysteine ligase
LQVRKPANPLDGARIVVGVCGGIAAYKAVETVRLLIKAKADVQVVMTAAARRFVGEITFQALTGRAVFTDMFALDQESEIGHIEVVAGADLLIIAPATANTIARIAAGLANDPLSAAVLAATAPLLLAPSMNTHMWENPLTQANLDRLVEVRGAHLVGPDSGFLACKTTGPGRLAEPVDIVEAAASVLTGNDLAGIDLVVSAGPTREALDPVRFLGNRSSGKMGYALARAASRRGASVKLISGPVALLPPLGVAVVDVVDAAAMKSAVARASGSADVVIMAAAVADFRPTEVAADKLKKRALGASAGADGTITLNLTPTDDILAGLGQERAERGQRRPLLVGFAAETESVLAHARDKLARKQCDLVVANDVSQADAGFAVDTNRVILVSAQGSEELELASKDEIAHAILDRVVAELAVSE